MTHFVSAYGEDSIDLHPSLTRALRQTHHACLLLPVTKLAEQTRV